MMPFIDPRNNEEYFEVVVEGLEGERKVRKLDNLIISDKMEPITN